MDFEWDVDKGAVNLTKHGVSFVKAMTIFGDPLEVMIADPDHSRVEFRFISIGLSAASRLLVVAYTERAGRTRVISAREATPKERRQYESGQYASRDDDMRAEYDFSTGVRGKHHKAYQAGTNVVFLDPDVAKVFTDSTSVNRVLRLLLRLAKEEVPSG